MEAPIRREQVHADEDGKLHLYLDAPSTPRGRPAAAQAIRNEANLPGLEVEGSLSVVKLPQALEMEIPVMRLHRRWTGCCGGGWRLHAVFNPADLPQGFTAEQVRAHRGAGGSRWLFLTSHVHATCGLRVIACGGSQDD